VANMGGDVVPTDTKAGPYGLWIFGETGAELVFCVTHDGNTAPETERAILLFPEAEQRWTHFDKNGRRK
jgi:hypothetical protein